MRIAILLMLVVTPLLAQSPADRYELGRRTHDFELAWDVQADNPAAKKRAAPLVNQAVQNFFRFNFEGVAKSLDSARQALQSEDAPSDAVRWAETIAIRVNTRLLDSTAKELTVTAKPFYKPDNKAPTDARLRVQLGKGKPTEVELKSFPLVVNVPTLDSGPENADLVLTADIVCDGKVAATRMLGVSRVANASQRLEALQKLLTMTPTSVEQSTLAHLVKLLSDLIKQEIPETDYPAARLLAEAEALAKKPSDFYTASNSGEFWLSLPTGKTSTVIRIQVPTKLDPKKPVPVVFALHGMGGSENMFFDAYGNGIVPKKCAERGWIVVAPRVNGVLGTGPAPNVPAILDELAKRYPIDSKRVFVVGHSMGAGHATTLLQQTPERFAAVAMLGGAGRVNKNAMLKKAPVFVGCGNLDFALRSSKGLQQALLQAEADVTFQEYTNIEHLTIVREAAKDVFAFFEKAAPK